MSSEEKPVHEFGTKDSWHGVIKEGGQFPPEHGRYHLYIGLFCPFAHRANLVRHVKGLTDIIPISVVKGFPLGDSSGYPGWKFPEPDEDYPNATQDHLFGSKYLHEVYFKADPEYKGRYTVPLLWDKKANTAVSAESAEILRWLPNSFNSTVDPEKAKLDLYPPHLRSQIDSISEWMQSDLNAGVYKAGFASDQAVYDKNVPAVFLALNKLERIISENGGPFILGKEMTELDIRAYATIVRFDPVYVLHFKTNLGTIRHNYPVINNWLKNLYWNVPGFKETTDFRHIKDNYFRSHYGINPKAIVPMGPLPQVEEGFEPDFSKIKPGKVEIPPEILKGVDGVDVGKVYSTAGNFSIDTSSPANS